MNGRTTSSDGGDDTGSQGGSESDASRTDSRHPTRAGSVKKAGSFRPVSFAKFSVPKAPGAPAASKAPEKGTLNLPFFTILLVEDRLMKSKMQGLCLQLRRWGLHSRLLGRAWSQRQRVTSVTL